MKHPSEFVDNRFENDGEDVDPADAARKPYPDDVDPAYEAMAATEDVVYDDHGYHKKTGVDKDGFAPPRAAFDLLRLKLTSEGAATVLGACLTAAATLEAEGGLISGTPSVVDRAFDLLRHIERTIR